MSGDNATAALLWVPITRTLNTSAPVLSRRRFVSAAQLDACSARLGAFTRVHGNTNRVRVEWTAGGDFLMTVEAVSDSDVATPDGCGDDALSCRRLLGNTSWSFVHETCIRKDLLCNCDAFTDDTATTATGDECARLMRSFDAYSVDAITMAAESSSTSPVCDYYAHMNAKCRRARREDRDNNDDAPVSLVEQPGAGLSDDEMSRLVMAPHQPPLAGFSKVYVDSSDSGDFCSNVIRANSFGWIASPNFYE